MASDESSGARPPPVVLRIKLRYDDVEAMVQRFAPNVGKSGLFLPTKSLQAVGAEVKFELRLADDKPVLIGLGRVKAARAPDPANPKAAFGMAIELMRVTRESREVILKMLERRKVLGLPEIGIPHPADIDAARRSEVVDTSVKDTANTAVPAAAMMVDSAPVLATQLNPDSGPVMTAPRRNTGPLAIAKAHNVAPLGPEAPRKQRAAVAEVIERASGPISVGAAIRVPDLDDDVDVVAVLVRARALAGGNLDDELDALREASAAPIEIGVEAASAELAKQLGGVAVRRDRSAKWAPPPSTISAPVDAPIEAKVEAPVVDSPVVQAPIEVRAEPIFEAPAAAATFVEPPSDLEPEPAEAGTPSPDVIELRDSTPILDVEPDPEDAQREDAAHEVDADQIADEIHQLGEGDVEEVEHTQIGALPVDPSVDPEAFQQHVFVTEPAVTADLERSLDRYLADAEAEVDDLDLARAQPEAARDEELEDDPDDEIEDFEILAEADAEDADLLSAHGEQEASGAHVIGSAPSQLDADSDPDPELEPEPERAAPEQLADEHSHIPARIRAQQRRGSGHHQVVRSSSPVPRELEPEPYEPDQRPSFADFASRLELSDEFEAAPEEGMETPVPFPDRHVKLSELDNALGELEPRSLGEIDPRSLSAGHALAAFEDPDGEPSNEEDYESESAFTIAGDMPVDSIDFDAPPVDQPSGLPPLHAFDSFDSSDVSVPMPRVNLPARAPKVASAAESYDLETALEALDVDLDDLSIPHEPVPAPARTGRQARTERVVPKRVDTDIPIDFDEE